MESWPSRLLRKLASLLGLSAPSPVPTLSEETGQKLTDVLLRAWSSPFSVSSAMARSHAAEIALAASAGLITTEVKHGEFGRSWRITARGIDHYRSSHD